MLVIVLVKETFAALEVLEAEILVAAAVVVEAAVGSSVLVIQTQ